MCFQSRLRMCGVLTAPPADSCRPDGTEHSQSLSSSSLFPPLSPICLVVTGISTCATSMGASVDSPAPGVTRDLPLGMGWCGTLARTRRTLRCQCDIRIVTSGNGGGRSSYGTAARCSRRSRCMGATLGARVEREGGAGSDTLCRHGGAEVGNIRDTRMRWRPWSLSFSVHQRASGVAVGPCRPAPADCAMTKRQPLPVLTRWTRQPNPSAVSATPPPSDTRIAWPPSTIMAQTVILLLPPPPCHTINLHRISASTDNQQGDNVGVATPL